MKQARYLDTTSIDAVPGGHARTSGATRALHAVAAVALGIALGIGACRQAPGVEEGSPPPAAAAPAALPSSSPGTEDPRRASASSYLVFHVFSGIIDHRSGVFTSNRGKDDYQQIAKRIKSEVGPEQLAARRRLGFAIGPLALDQPEAERRQLIRDAFDIALATDLAVAFHLDDYMFWKNARDGTGRLLRDNPSALEWKDWRGTPSDPLKVGWIPSLPLAPQLCYESPEVKAVVIRAGKDVIGQELRKGLDRLKEAAREDLFAGVIVGWESNLADGYCSLTRKGFSEKVPPKDVDMERARIVHDHIDRWARAVFDAGIDSDKIYTHIAPIPRRHYERLRGTPMEQRRQIPQFTNYRAFWTAFNGRSNPGFSVYADDELLVDIYDVLASHGWPPWALAEGSNVVLDSDRPPPTDWETFLGRFFNHGARLVSIFGGWQGDHGRFSRAAESPEAVAAYKKFLRGESLVERSIGVTADRVVAPGAAAPGLDTRLKALHEKITRYQQAGGNMAVIEQQVKTLDQYLRGGDVDKAEASLRQLEDVLR